MFGKAVRLAGFLFLLATMGLAQTQPTVSYSDDFQSYGTPSNPPGWVDTSIGVPKPTADGLYKAWPDPSKSTNIVYGTKQASGKPEGNNPRVGSFSTLTSKLFSAKGRFQYRGRMIRTTSDARIGLTFLSSYPEQDKYYLIGLWSKPSDPTRLTMQLFGFGAGTPAGTVDSDLSLDPNRWYQFLIQVDDADNATKIHARFWPDGTTEPTTFSIDASDSSAARLTTGRIGMWSAVRGDAFIDDLSAKSPVDFSSPVITFVDADTQRVLDPTVLALFKTPARIEIRVTDDLSTVSYTARLDDTSDYVSASPIAVDGLHKIKVHAVDAPGNTADASLDLLVDQKPPVVTLQIDGSPFPDGAVFNKDVTLSAVIQDISTVRTVSNLDGNNITLPVPVADEKLHQINVTATDQVGWQTVAAESFIVDKTPPVIVIKANGTVMNGGESFAADVTLTWTATDLTLDQVTATLDNHPITSGTVVTVEGLHTLVVTATDRAGHSKSESRPFALDKTAPEVHLLANGTPFVQGTTFNTSVTFTAQIQSATPTTQVATIDGQSYTLGTAYGVEGPHSIKVVVTNAANLSTTVGPFPFTIDLTRPTVALTESGQPFHDGMKFARDVNPVVTAGDNLTANPQRTLYLDGNLYPLDTLVSEEKVDHTISATATDAGGNSASVGPFHFMLDKTKPVVTIVEAQSGKPFPADALDALYGRAVSVKITVVDMTQTTLVATVDGAPLAVGPDGVSAPISGDGVHTVSAIATDEVGNRNDAVTASFTIDTTPPHLTFTSHHDGDVVTTPQVVVAGGADDAQSGTVNDLLAIFDTATKTFTSATLSLVEGRNVITVTGTDKAGNAGSASIALILDTRAPEIAIGAPDAGACVDAATLTVSGTATDPRIAAVTVNGIAATLDAAKGTWTASVTVAEGKQLLTVVATDAVGHSSTVTRSVVVDRTAPVVDVRESGAPFTATLLNRMISLLVRATDADPNVAVSAKLDGYAYASGATIGEGTHSLAVSATDCAGHKTDRTYAFTIDLTPPVIRSLNPANGATVGQTPTAISGVTDTDAARVEVVGSTLSAAPNADGTFTIASVPFADGVNRFTLQATDRAGNNSQIQYFVTVKTAAPIVTILESGSPLVAGTLFNRSVTPEIKVNDPAATIAATLNGAPFNVTPTSGTTITADGNYALAASATDALNHTGHADTTFIIDRTPPVVKITSPAAGVVSSDHIEVRGTAGDAVSATVNGIPVTLAAGGTFVLPSLPVDFGTTPIVATGTDRAGNTGRDEVDVTLADLRPGIILTYPPDHSLTNRPATEVLGRVLSAPPDGVVTIGTQSVPVDPSGAFRLSGYALVEGSNTITASVKNQNGTTNSASVQVTGDFTPPALTILESGQPLADDARFATQAVLSLNASDSGGGSVTSELTLDGTKVVTLPVTVTTTGGHSASATARDAAGNESRADRTFFIGTTTGGTGSSCALSDFDPKDGSVVLSATATLVGRSGGALGVKVNGVAASVADGSFRATVELPNEGPNLVTIVCTDGGGTPTGTPLTITLNRVTGDPSISIATPAEGFATASDTITVTGTVGAGVVTADVNGTLAAIAGGDTTVARPFTAANVRLADGLNVLAAHGKNGAGRVATASRRVFLLKNAPTISISSPISGVSTGAANIYVCGTWTNLDPATIVITNLASAVATPTPGVAASDTTGTFKAYSVALVPGEQTLKVTGRDRLDREASATVTVKLVAGAPSIVIMQPPDHAYFGPAAGDTFAVSGTFQAAAGSTVEVNGAAAAISGNGYSATIPFATGAGGLTPVVARATEPGGTSAIAAIVVTRLAAAPKVIESFPAPNAVEVDPGALLLVLFSAPMDRVSIAGGGFRLEDASGATVGGTLYLDKDVVTFAPAALLTRGSHYTIRVTTAAKDVAGTALEAEYVAGFTVGTSAPSTPPVLTPVASAFCGQTVIIKGTAPAGARLQLESGSLTLPATADAQGNFSVSYPLSGQSGYATVRVRIVGSDGSLSPAAELTFRIDCVGPQVLNATYERTGANRIAIVFSEAIDAATTAGAISMTLSDGRVVAGTAAVTGSNAIVTSAEDLTARSFSLNVTTAVKDLLGNKLVAPYTQSFSLSTEQPPAGDGTGFISGEIYDATTGRPLAGASISVEVPAQAFARIATQQHNSSTAQPLKSSTLSVQTTTDARGRYLVRLPEGAHTIRATMSGYTTVWRQIIVAAGAGVIPIDVRLTRVGDVKTSTGAALTLTHGGETSVTRNATLSIPGGVVASGKSVSLTAVGGQALTGLLPLGWSPVAAAEVVSEVALTNAQLTFAVPAAELTAAAQNLTAVRYDELRDSWQVVTPVVNVSGGNAAITINSAGAYALVYPDKAAGLAQPALPAAGAPLQGVAVPSTLTPLTARTFHLDPAIVLPNGRTVATVTIEGLGGATFPSGTAVQAYIDEELKLADGSTLLDPPFATDLLLYRSLNGETGVTDFHLAPSPRAAQVILEVGFDHIRVVPYPGRLDRGTLIGSEGGRVPADDKVALELPTGATPEPLRATAASLTQSDLDAVGSIAGFHILGGFNVTLQRATEPAPQDLDGDGKPDAVPPVELFKPARATFTVDTTKLPSLTSSLILAELLDVTPYGKMVRLAAQMMPIDPLVAGASARFTTRTIDRSLLPVDGVIREGRYLLLAADAPIAYATGSVHLGAGGSLLANARVGANALGVADITRTTGIYNVPVVAAPAGPFTLTPRHVATGDGAAYTHSASVAAESVNKIDLNLVPQPPSLTSVTVIGADASQLALNESTGTANVALTTNVRASFSPSLDPASIDESSIVVVDAQTGSAVGGKAAGDATGVTWSLTPGQRLKNNNRYSATVSSHIRGSNGAPFGRTASFGFTTVAQVTSGEVHADRIGITIPDANGLSRVFGTAGALPSGWQAVPVRRTVDFLTRYQATAAADGSFSFNIGDGPDLSDRVTISDLIDLQVVNAAGNLAAIIPLTPFVTADHRGFVAPANIEVKFTSADGIAVTVPAGTFDQATIINIVPTTAAAVADVPHIEQDVEYAASVRLDFDGTAHKAMEIELPVPAGLDTSGKNFILGYRGDSVRGPRIMAVDTLRIVDGKFSTTLDPNASVLRAAVMSRGKAAGQQTLTGKDLKNYLMRVQRSGVYMALDIRVPVGGGVGWAVMDGLQAAYDIFWDTLASFYAAHYYVFERGRIVVPIIQGKPFTVVGVDSTTGLQGFSKVYDPIPVGDPNVAVTIPSPQDNTNGPYPIFGIPFRTEMADVNAEKVDIEEVRNFKLRLENDQISLKPGNTPLPAETRIEFLDITNGKYAAGTAGQTLTVDGKAGDRVVILVEQQEVDPNSAITVTFNEPIFVTGSTEDDISTFLEGQLMLERADEPAVAGAAPAYSDITKQAHYRLDSGGRRLAVDMPSSLQRESVYRLTLKKEIADRSGANNTAGLKLAQGTKKDQNGQLQPAGGENDLHLVFHVRKPGGKLAAFDIATGFVRDTALNGNVLLVTASAGSDGTGAALMAYDVADPASLNPTNGTPPVPLAKVTTVNYTSFWAVASDPHGRVYVTEQGSVLGSLHSYRLEDLVTANGGTVPQKGATVTNWTLGYSSSIGLISNTILSDRPESIPRKLQIIEQDDDVSYDGREAFKTATGATEAASYTGSSVKKYSVSIPFDASSPYLLQRVTVENISLDMRWSADASPSGPAVIQNIIAQPNDRIKVSKNLRTYGVISHMGYGIGVYDLNAMESNDAPNRPSGYREVQEQVVLSPGKNDPECFQPNTSTPKPPDYAIQEIYLSAEAAVRGDPADPSKILIYAPDPYRGLLDMRFSPDKYQNNPDPAISPSACDTRGPIGLILRATDPTANHPRIQALMNAYQSAAGRQPFIHFISVSPYNWRREKKDNAKGVRGSIPDAAVSRDYILLAGGDLGVVVVEVGGNPAPNLPGYPSSYWPLKNEHVADIIWVPGGAVAVRAIPRTNLAVIVDRAGRVLLADLSRLDERFDRNGVPIPGAPLFETVAKCLTLPATDPGGVGAYDPRIVWKSEPGIVTGSLAPVVDGDTGMLYAGELLRKAMKVVAALDPRIEMKVDIGEETGLSEVGGIVPLGVAPPKEITDRIDALPACTSGGTARCKENASLGVFRLELTLPGGMVDALTQSNKQLQLAVESERVFNAVTEQTPGGFPRSHLRRFKRDGSAELTARVATNFKMQRVVPDDPALNQVLRRQRGFNKFISPWIVALDDPRAGAQYDWAGATATQKKDAGCDYCSRPKYLDGKSESDGVYELWTNGRLVAVRPEFITSSGSSTTPDTIFANTPYAYLGKQDRLVSHFATIMADTVRPTDVRVAGQNPPVADGMIQESLLLHSGEMTTASVDLVAGGRAGFDVSFDRNYRSRTIGGTFLGLGWESSMFRRLRALPNGDVELRDGAGELWLFKRNAANDGYDSPKGLFIRLAHTDTGWSLIDQKWRVTLFDLFGRLSAEFDQFYRADSQAASQAGLDNGNIIRYLYDENGRLTEIVDAVKRSTTLTYWKDSEASQSGAYPGLLKEVKDWRDRTIRYEYDSKGQLKAVKLPEVKAAQGVPSDYDFTGTNRPKTQYGYKVFAAPAAGATPTQAFNDYLELQNLETITDPAQAATSGDPRVTFKYDETADALQHDREKLQTWATGESASFKYNSATDVETTDVLGQKRKYTLTDKTQYDKRVHVSESTLVDVPVVDVTSGLPARADLNMSPGTKSLTSKYQFNDEGLHSQEDYPNGLSITNGWVPTGNSGPGMVLKDATQTGALINTEKTVFNYDSDTASGTVEGVTRTATNGSGDRDAQTPSRERLVVETKDENVGHKDEYNPSGLLKSSQTTDGSGNVTLDVSPIYYAADATLPITRSRVFSINKGVLKETFVYSTTSTGGYHVHMTDTVRGTTTDTDYDARDRKVHEVIADGNSGAVLSDESFGYDANGRQAYSARKQKDVGNAVSRIDYDAIGREKERTLSGAAVNGGNSTLSTTTTYDLQNRKITRYDPSVGGGGPNYEISTLDRLGRPASRERVGTGGASLKSVYGYDAGGAQVYVTDTTRIASLRQLDEMQREVATVASDGIKTQNRLDQWGQVIESTQTDSNGAVIGHFTQFYTKNGRLRGVNDELNSGGRTRQTRYGWDDGDITTSTRVGQTGSVSGVSFPSGKVRARQTTRDSAGRVKEELIGEASGASGAVDASTAFARTEYGYQGSVPNMVTKSEPLAGGSSLSIVMYDGLARPLEVAQAGGSSSTKSDYDEAGNVTSYTAPGMNEETATFDSRGLATKRIMSDGKTLQYEYDAAGNLLNLKDESGENTIYTPDGLGRTVRVQYYDGTTEETQYEPGSGFVTATRDRAGQWISYEYDANGRVTADHDGLGTGGAVLTKYEYDGGGRLTAIRNKDAAIEYADFDLIGRPATTRTIRYSAGSGLGNGTVLDVHTQKHGWAVHDGERDSWRMPAAGWTAPTQDDPASPWLQTITEDHDAGSNVVRQLAGGTLLSEAVGRGIGRLLLRRQIVGSKTIDTNYGFADGTTTAGGVKLPSGSTANKESLLLHWTQTKVNSTVVGGSANARDASNRVTQSRDQGFGDRISQWGYDDRGRLSSSWLNVPGPSPSTSAITDTLIDADFRSARTEPPMLSPADHAKLGTTAVEVEPLSWTATRNSTQQIGDRTLYLDGQPQLTRTYAFTGGRRVSDGKWTSAFDSYGRLASISSFDAGRKIAYVWDPNDRMIGRVAYKLDSTNNWVLEDRTEVLARDGLPADSTFVWDPLADRLLAIYEAGKSTAANAGPEQGLIRQYLHGDQGYDDPVRVLTAGPTGVTTYLPIIDQAGAGSLQAVVDSNGTMVERVLFADSYGDAPRFLQGPVVDRISLAAQKDGNGVIQSVDVRVHLTETIDSSTVANGARLAAVDSSRNVVYETSVTPTAEDDHTIHWSLDGTTWNALANAGGAASLEVAVGKTLRATAWGNATVTAAPGWTIKVFGTDSSADFPVITRQSFADVATFFAGIPSSEKKSTDLYAIRSLYLAGTEESKTKLLFDFHALPFRDPATHVVYARARWYDPSTGTFLTPDPMGFFDSSNLYAYGSGDPVNMHDPSGECEGACIGALIGTIAGSGYAIYREIRYGEQFFGANGAWRYIAQGAAAGAAIGFAIETGGAGAPLSAKILAGTAFGGGLGGAVGSVAGNGDWATFGKSATKGGILGGIGAGTGAAIQAANLAWGWAFAGSVAADTYAGVGVDYAFGDAENLSSTVATNAAWSLAGNTLAEAGAAGLNWWRARKATPVPEFHGPVTSNGEADAVSGARLREQYMAQDPDYQYVPSRRTGDPINVEKANTVHNGVRYTPDGYPDFEPFAIARAEIHQTGFNDIDFKAANLESGIGAGIDSHRLAHPGFTWHHHQNGTTMLLVPTPIHNAARHSGGASIARHAGGLH